MSKRKRARLAMCMLAPPRRAAVGDYVLFWGKVEKTEDGHILANVTTKIGERAFTTQRVLIERTDVVLATSEPM